MPTAPSLSDLQYMDLHISTLFDSDPGGRLRYVNEVGNPPAPRFFMGRTNSGNRWRFRYDLPNAVVEQLNQLCLAEPLAHDLARVPQNYTAIRAVLDEHAPIQAEYRGPAYWIPIGLQRPANVVTISESNADLVRIGFSWLLPLSGSVAYEPIVATVVEGNAVALCHCSRIPGQATEAGLETMAPFRGMGYATEAVAGWSAEVWRRGCMPLYSTAWTNLASQRVAQKLGMVCYGEDWSIA